LLLFLSGANVAVFGAWQYAEQLEANFGDRSWLDFLDKNFTKSWANLEQGRV